MKTRVRRQRQLRVCQGDIFRDIEYIEYVREQEGIIEVSKVVFPLVIVLTQDCDLAQDYMFRWSKKPTLTHDKYLISVLVAPLYNMEHVYRGEHLSELGLRMEPIAGKTKTDLIRSNQIPRFHYLEFPDSVPIVTSVIDFKHYFSVSSEYLKKAKKTNCVCRVSELFREDISHRFASFLSRVGLPDR